MTRARPAPPGIGPERRRWRCWAPLLLVLGCSDELQPHGQAVITVHTDLPVPRLAGALQIDAYDGDGLWFESRTVATPSPRDWPISFGVGARTPGASGEVTLRLRVGPAGRVRDYRGERALPRPTPPLLRVPTTAAELCQAAAPVDAPATVWVRRGEAPLAAPLAGCLLAGTAPLSAVTAFQVRIARAGLYRIALLDTYPSLTTWAPSANALFVRRDCGDPASEVACADARGTSTAAPGVPVPPTVELELDVGAYTVLLGSRPGDPLWTDLIVRVAPVDAWDAGADAVTEVPLLEGDAARTPTLEPDPTVTVDRLVPLSIPATGTARQAVVLRGACTGLPARLAAELPTERLVEDEAATCVAEEGQLVPLAQAQAPAASPEGADFGRARGCAAPPIDSSRICVPGGAFLLGDPRGFGEAPPDGSVPERIARVSPFYLDRHEVTVARYRAALTEGLELPPPTELERNPGALARSLGQDAWRSCSFSADPLPAPDAREDHALTCIDWAAARAYCQHVGGDLPTEAQWEYAATAVGGEDEREFPWGSLPAAADCGAAVFGRLGPVDLTSTTAAGAYLELGTRTADTCGEFGPLPASARDARDVTPGLGVVGMAGGVSEWTLDAAYPLDHACWRTTPLDDPACAMEAAALRTVRGGSWVHGWHWLAGTSRGHRAVERRTAPPAAYVGFRCAYPAEEAAP